jgi:beta-glucosidase
MAVVRQQPWRESTAPTEQRIELLMGAMSVEERICVALADFAAVSHLGIPPFGYCDGGSGVRGADGVTAFPVTLALAATFNPELAVAYGGALGAEVRAAGRNVLLGPGVDIVRTPLGGRQPETFGEDPWLAGEMASAHVRGVQRHPVVSVVKHLVANNFETLRTGEGPASARGDAVDIRVDERTLHEAYLAPFKKVMLRAGAWGVMGSYNRLNGEYACQNADLFSIVKQRWRWPGFVAPDFMFAVRDAMAAARAGLDIPELGSAGRRTAEMFRSGAVPEQRLDDIVRRILRAAFAAGLFDNPLTPAVPFASESDHVAVATRVAEEGTVLLVNRAALLPLDASGLRRIAVIGPATDDAIYVVSGSGGVSIDPGRRITPLEGIAARAGPAVDVVHTQGSWGDAGLPTVPRDAFADPGLVAEYRSNQDCSPTVTLAEHVIDRFGPPDGINGDWSARWTGRLVPRVDGVHRFSLTVAGEATLLIDGHPVVTGRREAVRIIMGPELPLQATAKLRAGEPVALRVEFTTGPALEEPSLGLVPGVHLGWQEPDSLVDDAAALAATSDVAVVLVQQASGEGMDRASLDLPGDQDRLVRAVAEANPRTVVVLNTPGPVLMPWLPDVAAVLQVWYPGQQFGAALARVLFGDADPGGRLPVTYPADARQGPQMNVEIVDGRAVARYDEGPLVGYRFYDSSELQPLFPFGHGLSYATVEYSNLVVSTDPDAGGLRVDVELSNSSRRSGLEVVQVYVSWPESANQPPRQLRGIVKLSLEPGQSAVATCVIPGEELTTYRPDGRWRMVDGEDELAVGRSSRDLKLGSSFFVSHDEIVLA